MIACLNRSLRPGFASVACSDAVPRRGAARRGISLIEVLISMGILTFGLLGVAALFPVGHAYVLRASKYDRAAAVGQAAFNEIKTRGLLATFDRTDPNDPWLLLPSGNAAASVLGPNDPLTPFQFDPLASQPIDPSATASPPARTAMKWVITKTLTAPSVPIAVPLSAAARAAAQRVFTSRDDLTVDLPDDRDQPSVQQVKIDPSSGTPLYRQYQGNFSWMFTVVPAVDTPDDDLYLVSVAVFYKRNTDGERTRDLSTIGGTIEGGFGGGELILPTAEAANVRAGDWLMISALPAGQPAFYRWYRVLNTAELDNANTSLSILGPDWPQAVNTSSGTGTAVRVSLFDTVIGVYEKTMRLEGLSLYSIPR